MEQQQIIAKISAQLLIKTTQADAVLELSSEGCTIPFIARYRKERTQNLDEVQVAAILELFEKFEELEKRREYIISYLTQQEKLTPELGQKLNKAQTISELEDIYLPFKPRKKTLADKAIELGLLPLAEYIKKHNPTKSAALVEAQKYITEEVKECENALEHALNILVQEISDNAEVRSFVRAELRKGIVESSVKRGKKEEGQKYRDYFEYKELCGKIPAHRIMALLRGEKEGFLNLTITQTTEITQLIEKIQLLNFPKKGELLFAAAEESYKRHLLKSLGNEIWEELSVKAEIDCVSVFAKNLEKILLFPPFGEKAVIGIDPGIRTGCKVAVIDQNGNFRHYVTLFLNDRESDAEKLLPLIESFNVKAIAIGSGTFGRETFKIVKKVVKNIVIALVDEDGASVYSASETARDEFPELDLTVRGAISIGRRFQDPMAELVKIDPKALGIGQYQHDITPKLLEERLKQTIEWAVNRVGVNLNTASPYLLSYISGLDKRKAKEIAAYRAQSKFKSREELKKVKGIGEKAFEQSAGFLRLRDSKNILDGTGVHPESYHFVDAIAKLLELSVAELIEKPELIDVKKIKASLTVPELETIVSELKQKGLDPRDEYKEVHFSEEISSINDLKQDMVLTGVVDNVTNFGAFVDIGIKEKGLVHISEVSDTFIKDINTVLSVGDEVTVKVMDIDCVRKRISLSIKQAK